MMRSQAQNENTHAVVVDTPQADVNEVMDIVRSALTRAGYVTHRLYHVIQIETRTARRSACDHCVHAQDSRT